MQGVLAVFSPERISDIMRKAAELRQQLEAEGYDQHDQMLAIETEGEALELFDAYAERVVADERLAASARERAKRLERRADIHKGMLVYIMQVLRQKRLERPLVTASMARGRTSLDILEADKVPAEFRTEIDKAQLAKALKDGREVAGAQLKTGADYLVLRTL